MTTTVQYKMKWLRVRLQKPTQPRSRPVSKKDEGPTGPPNAAELDALTPLFPGQQSCRRPSAVAPIARQQLMKERSRQ